MCIATHRHQSNRNRGHSEQFGMFLPENIDAIAYVGDSPNDSPMFEKFPNSIGVANIAEYANRMPTMPTYITKG